MALRAFRSNPSIGGFGGESGAAIASGRDRNVGGRGVGGRDAPTSPGKRAGKSAGGGHASDSCDAFAQIVKELVDNAVDACGGGDADAFASAAPDAGRDGPAVLKRVRVQIDAAQRRGPRRGDDHGDGGSAGGEAEVLRVTVSDNGCGMDSIEDCVAAFRTSKSGGGAAGGNGAKVQSETEDNSEQEDPRGRRQQHTAGRYGIGLTLCLLHAQRLVPNSKASITSATALSTNWTRASYVVDADSDEVRCVEKELRPKKRKDESGTAVSLLVPGGDAAQRAWPRLAEYLSRFHLSIHLMCSLEVKAPTLSSVPLFIRPPLELERRRMIQQNRQREYEKKSQDQIIAPSDKDGTRKDDDSACWNDGMIDADSVQSISMEDCDHESNSDRRSNNSDRSKGSNNGNDAFLRNQADQKRELEEQRRRLILQGGSSYLKTPIELKNVAHSLQPIRKDRAESSNLRGLDDRRGSNKPSRPMLEVDLIVYRSDENDFITDEDESNTEGDDVEVGDELDNMFSRKENLRQEAGIPLGSETSGSVAPLMLLRMVNRIPLLDSAEASACGIVWALSHQAIWNSFGLDVSISNDNCTTFRNTTSSSSGALATFAPSPDLHIPTYSIRDSVQVAPFFQSSTHSLFELDEEESDTDGREDDVHCDDMDDGCVNEKRKRKAKTRLLPAGLRLGNVLVITQIHAKPSSLPLPTLSKGRLPLNDKGIDDALQVGLTSCLRSLQRTNPGLLLTTHQLKETERDVRYIPAVSASLASIVSNTRNQHFQQTMVDKIVRWESRGSANQTKKSPAAPEVTPEDFSERKSAENPVDSHDLIVAEGTNTRSTLCTPSKVQTPRTLLCVNKLGPLIEDQIRFSIAENKNMRKMSERQKKKKKKRKQEEADEGGDIRSIEGSTRNQKNDGVVYGGEEASVDLDSILRCKAEGVDRCGLSQSEKISQESRIDCPVNGRNKSSCHSDSSFSSHCKSSNRNNNRSMKAQQSLSSLSSNSVQSEKEEHQHSIMGGKKLGIQDDFDDDDWW